MNYSLAAFFEIIFDASFREFCAPSTLFSSTSRRTPFTAFLIWERLVLFRSFRFSFCRLRLSADLWLAKKLS